MSDFITYSNIWFNQYINLSYTVENGIRNPIVLATAINYFYTFNEKIKKEIYSTTFDTFTVNSSLILSTDHSILSPISTSIILAIVAGSVVLTEFLVEDPLLSFVFCLNNITILSIMFLFIIISVSPSIYMLLDMFTFKKVNFIYYLNQFIIRDIFSEAATFENYSLLNLMSDLNEIV